MLTGCRTPETHVSKMRYKNQNATPCMLLLSLLNLLLVRSVVYSPLSTTTPLTTAAAPVQPMNDAIPYGRMFGSSPKYGYGYS